MRLRLILPAIVLMLVVLSACSTPNLRNERFLQDTSLVEAFSTECDLPCWRGITPGVTAWNDTIALLEDMTDVNDPQVQEIPESGEAVGASWQPVEGDLCCNVVSEDGDTVSSIFLQLAPTVTLGQLIAERGDPLYVLGTPGTDDQAVVNLYYPDLSMIVFVFVAGATNGQLNESSEVIGIFLTTEDRIQLGIQLSNLYAWDGYQPFSAYSPDVENPNYIVTQSVTLTPTVQATPAP
jgi:hypothetical protein